MVEHTKIPKSSLEKLYKRLGHTFNHPELLIDALTLACGSHKAKYERLEFLGDRVLGLVVAEMVYTNFPQEAEGDLARRFTKLTEAETLAEIADNMGIKKLLFIPKSEQANVKTHPQSFLCDIFESVLGALYLDAGFSVAQDFVKSELRDRMLQYKVPPIDNKSRLQEWVQSKALGLPLYKTIQKSGCDHEPLFTVSVTIEGYPEIIATGTSKKNAEAGAAALFLNQFVLKDKR